MSLTWTGALDTYTLYRAPDPSAVTDPLNEVGNTIWNVWTDVPPAGDIWFYQVVGTCTTPNVDCTGVCADLASDPLHCGVCGNACDFAFECATSACIEGPCYPDVDTDGDSLCDLADPCPDDPNNGDYDGDGVLDCLEECPYDPDKLEPGICGCGVPDTDSDDDGTADCHDFCDSDPDKTERGTCGCGVPDDTLDGDGDGIIDCRDQCPGFDDSVDSDSGGMPDACDPCPSGLCSVTLPDRFYAELPDVQVLRISRDGRLIAGINRNTMRGVLIPTEDLIANPGDTSYYEYLPEEIVGEILGFSDDNNVVLTNIYTTVPESSYEVTAAALYDRTHGTWRVLGLYDSSVNIDSCRFYSNGADLTSDGKVVYGRTSTVERPCKYSAFHYDTESEEWQIFGGPDGAVRLVKSASGTGERIVGSENSLTVGVESPVLWRHTPPAIFDPEWLGVDGGFASDVTFDGTAVALTVGALAHRWTESGGLQQLGPGTLDSQWGVTATAISDGGNVVTGYHTYLLSSSIPFIWIEGLTFGSLIDYLAYRGHTDIGNMNDDYLPWDVGGPGGRIIVGRTGTLSGLPGWVLVTVHE